MLEIGLERLRKGYLLGQAAKVCVINPAVGCVLEIISDM